MLWAVLSGLLIALPTILGTSPSRVLEKENTAAISVGALSASLALGERWRNSRAGK